MEKEILLVCLAVSALLLSGCPAPPEPTELPEDFAVEYGTGAMHLEWGNYDFKVDRAGNASFTKEIEIAISKTYEFTVSEEELTGIYNASVENNFFFLQGTYQDPAIMDGGWSEITITADAAKKTVTLLNYAQPQFGAVEDAIVGLIVSKLGADCFSFNDLKADCGSKKTECAGKDDFECHTWEDFCGWGQAGAMSPEFCDNLWNRQECVDFCSRNECSKELCLALVFDADGCTSCGAGCCSECRGLDSCTEEIGCRIAWIHPAGESWQFGGCENRDFCWDGGAECNYLSLSYQGYRYTAGYIEGDAAKAAEYGQKADELQDRYNEECNSGCPACGG